MRIQVACDARDEDDGSVSLIITASERGEVVQ